MVEAGSQVDQGENGRSREVRLGLVMYGGVSLAVYINGACREFYDLVRGRGIWGIVKDLADVDVTVDIVSGASAGGINGLFLSYALCNEREFGPLATLWREKAGIQRLLRDPGSPEASSLLDSDYLERELEGAFRAMDRARLRRDLELGDPGRPEELDCFLAVTDFKGHTETIGDFRQSPLRVKNHAARLHLKHRRGRFEAFATDAGGNGSGVSKRTLARFARATSAFPVAFEPVLLSAEEAGRFFDRRASSLDASRTAVFVDGGVLDNKPFTPILPAIYGRHSDRPVTRLVFFVEPDPAEGDEVGSLLDDAGGSAASPNFLQVALASLTSLPSYESIADDLQALDDHNRRLDLLKTVLGDLYGSVERGDPFAKAWNGSEPAEPSPEQWRVYHRSRLHRLLEGAAQSLSAEVIQAVAEELGAGPVAPEGLEGETSVPPPRLGNRRLFDELFPGLARSLELEDLVTGETGGTRRWQGRAAREAGLLDDLDFELTKRAYYYWTYALHDVLNPMVDERHRRSTSPKGEEPAAGGRDPEGPESPAWCAALGDDELGDRIDAVRRALRELAERIDMLLIVEGAIARLLRDIEPPREGADGKPLATVRAAWSRCLACAPEVSAVASFAWELEDLEGETPASTPVERFRQRLDRWLAVRPPAVAEPAGDGETEGADGDDGRRSLLDELRRALDGIMDPFWGLSGNGRSAYEEFRRIDCLRYPAFLLSQLGEMDRIDYVRISPRDSCCVEGSFASLGRWDDDPMSKVCGRHLGHFGAFLKRSWRSNDIMWGRIDAATILYDALIGTEQRGKLHLSRARAARLLEDDERRATIASAPTWGSESLLRLVEAFAEDDIDAASFRKRLLEHHQQRICREGVCEVLSDAAYEEALRRNPTYDLDLAGARTDDLELQADFETQYRRLTLEVLHRFQGETADPLLRRISSMISLDPESLDDFFHHQYDVGAERVADLDRVGLTTMGFHSARVLANMSSRLLPDKGLWQKFKSLVLTRVVLGLTTFHLFSRSIRSGLFPLVWLATLLAGLGLLVAAIVADERSMLSIGILVVILGVLLFLPKTWFGRRRRLRWVGLLLLLVGGVTAYGVGHRGMPSGASGALEWIRNALRAAWSSGVAWLGTPWGRGTIAALLAGGAWWALRRWWKKRWPIWIGGFRIDDLGGPPGSLLTRIGRFVSFWRWRGRMVPRKGDPPAGRWRWFLSRLRSFGTAGALDERLETNARELRKLSWLRHRVERACKYLDYATEWLTREEDRLRAREETIRRERDDRDDRDDQGGGRRPGRWGRVTRWLIRRRRPEVA